MAQFYWAVRPVNHKLYELPDGGNSAVRIERAENPREAARMAFGGPLRWAGKLSDAGRYEAKNLGSRVAVIQSDNKRIALLRDPAGWEPVV